jgi:sucrose-6-phosphate hydrolase SacC (GH32 family)
MSLPRLLSPGPDGLLKQRPVPELRALRGKHVRLAEVDLTPAAADLLAGISGDTLEILAEFQPASGEAFGPGDVFGLKVRCSPDGAEQTLIVYDGVQLAVDRQQSSLDTETYADRFGGPLRLAAGETLKLHIFLDRSVVEVFGNYRTCVASRIYPSRRDSLGVGLFVHSGHVRLKSMDIWSMHSIWT